MSPILDLENLTPISLEELGEPKSFLTETSENKQKKEKELNESIEKVFITKEIKTEKKKLFIKKNTKVKTIQIIPPQQDNNLLLSIKDCEILSRISKVSIRKAIKEKEINYVLENGKYKISFTELLKWCYSSTRRKNVFNTQGIGKYVNEWKNIS